jgi:hypothetical protein
VVGNQQLDCFWGLPKKWEKLSWDLIFILLHCLFHNWGTAIKFHRTRQGELKVRSILLFNLSPLCAAVVLYQFDAIQPVTYNIT